MEKIMFHYTLVTSPILTLHTKELHPGMCNIKLSKCMKKRKVDTITRWHSDNIKKFKANYKNVFKKKLDS